MTNITKKLIEQIKNIDEPFNTDESIYLYLVQNGIIDFEYIYFKKIMAQYKYSKSSKSKMGKLNKTERLFCQAVEHLKTKTIYSVYKSLYEQSLSDPSVAIKFLKLYDRKEKKYNETIKNSSKLSAKNSAEDDDVSDKNHVKKNIDELLFLINNPQKSNKINIDTADSLEDVDSLEDICDDSKVDNSKNKKRSK